MRFSTATILGLAATSTAAVLPRSQLGSWALTFIKTAPANGFRYEDAIAVYTSDSYPEGITSKCSYVYSIFITEGSKEKTTCDNGLSYTYDGQTVTLSQVIQEPSPNTTIFGSAPLTLTSNDVGHTFRGNATVEVTSATA